MITHPSFALAANLGAGGSVVSPPVGSDVLPGGQTAESFRDSALIAKVLPFLIDYTLRLAIALSVGAIIIGGYQYLTAYGNTEQHETARKTIMYAIVGLVLSITSYGIVKILTNINFG